MTSRGILLALAIAAPANSLSSELSRRSNEVGSPPHAAPVLVTSAANGTWGVEFGESLEADNSAGEVTNGLCSGGASGYGCPIVEESVRSLSVPPLAVMAPSGNAPAAASQKGRAALGNLASSVTTTATYHQPYSSSSYAYGLQYWVDQIIPPAPDHGHPLGTPITYVMTLEDESKLFTVDCYAGNSTYEVNAAVSNGNGLSITNGCAQSGGRKQSTKFATAYGAGPSTISALLLINVYAADDAAHTSSKSSFPKIDVVVHVDSPQGVPYKTASGVCYKMTGSCN